MMNALVGRGANTVPHTQVCVLSQVILDLTSIKFIRYSLIVQSPIISDCSIREYRSTFVSAL